MKATDPTEAASHFAFGKNWASYAQQVTPAEVEHAIIGLRKLTGGDLAGKRFVDIGCGSGVHSLAALRLGAAEVVAFDIDSDSVATTRKMLQANAPEGRWSVSEGSVLNLGDARPGTFDVVYSWGVLHHTGAMYQALRCAADLVAPGGQFIFALYRKTLLCWLWKAEKRWYAAVGARAQGAARRAYIGVYRVSYSIARLRSFRGYLASYKKRRGMDFEHDMHDWLGGWPYESISPAETERFMTELGFQRVQAFARAGVSLGLFGSGCDEYVYVRKEG